MTQIHPIDPQDEAKGILQRYSWRGMLGILGRTLVLYIQNPYYRRFVRSVRQESGILPENLTEYLGYGLFVGRK